MKKSFAITMLLMLVGLFGNAQAEILSSHVQLAKTDQCDIILNWIICNLNPDNGH